VRIGLIVNPLAGLGGPLALKGSDNELGWRALQSGAVPKAGERATTALRCLSGKGLSLVTSAGAMGEGSARAAGIDAHVVHAACRETWSADTVAAAEAISRAGAELILFAGGDGTARDLLCAEIGKLPVLGIPAGVKMHSAVFATSPVSAGAAISRLVEGGKLVSGLAEVIDRDAADGTPRLYGLLQSLQFPRRQVAKASSRAACDAQLLAEARTLANELRRSPLALIGPGATMLAVKDALGAGGTLLGVDAYAYGRLVAADADAAALSALCRDRPPRIVLGVVGGQGFLLGRGNQQLSADIIRLAGPSGLTVLAASDKLAALAGGTLLVDSGDPVLDQMLAGYIPVRTGPRRTTMMRVEPA
jgi:predicted polyphosphate/ATP-dependent NAD kinase